MQWTTKDMHPSKKDLLIRRKSSVRYFLSFRVEITRKEYRETVLRAVVVVERDIVSLSLGKSSHILFWFHRKTSQRSETKSAV